MRPCSRGVGQHSCCVVPIGHTKPGSGSEIPDIPVRCRIGRYGGSGMNTQAHLVARVATPFARTERDKSCHFFPIPLGESLPESLHAFCGFEVSSRIIEQFDAPHGMPCVACMLLAQLER